MGIDDYISLYEKMMRAADPAYIFKESMFMHSFVNSFTTQLGKFADSNSFNWDSDFLHTMQDRYVEIEKLTAPVLYQFRNLLSDYQTTALSEINEYAQMKKIMGELVSMVDKFQLGGDLLFQSDIERMLTVPTSLGFDFIGAHFENTIKDIDQFSIFKESFAYQIFDNLGQIEIAEDARERRQLVDNLLMLLNSALDNLPKSWVGLNGFFAIILSIVLFLIQMEMDEDFEERLMQEISLVEARVTEKFDSIESQSTEPTLRFVVTKPVRLRGGPSTKHPILTVLQPNMYVEVLKSSGQWLFVEYFDFVHGETRSGWVYKRYLKELD